METGTRLGRLLLVGIVLSIVCSAIAHGQEEEEGKDESTKTEIERKNDQSVIDVLEGRKHFTVPDLEIRSADRDLYKLEHPGLPPTTFVNFGTAKGWSREIEFHNNYTGGSNTVPDLEYADDLYNSSDKFILTGSVTKADLDWFESRKLSVAYWTMYPANDDQSKAVAAVALTSKTFKTNEVTLLDALPSETGAVTGRLELTRMGLPGQPKDWLKAREEIREAAKGIPVHTATKTVLMNELKVGTTSLLVVIAHSDKNDLYLPGINGGRLPLSELKQVRREDAPKRVVVLLACKAAKLNNEVASIAGIILHNKLATSVLASDDYVYATDLGKMIAIFIASGNLNGAFPGLKTIVEKEEPFHGDQSFRVYPKSLANSAGE